MQRRTFIKTSLAASLASSATMKAFALAENNPFRKNIGIQLYTLRNQISEDTVGTLKAVAADGYKQVEPYGFPDADAMIKAAKDFGMQVNSSHFAWESVTAPDKQGVVPFDEILEKARSLGLTHLVVPYLHDHERKTLDDFKRIAHLFNLAAAKAKSAGIQLSYHNHNFEFGPHKGGKTGYDVLVEECSDDMKFEVDVFWVKLGGVEPVDLMKRLEGRVSQLHLKDLKRGIPMPAYDTGIIPKEAFKELGNGIIDMEPIIEAAWVAGVQHCHVEQDHSPNPLSSIKESMSYLTAL
ncbi:MAG: sugar phosphate isomerase/epimerase [Verrucomicrobiae bacterium]|nr:sugar phosphate isomerase/epimerase [Verrucomicrobiae bacterium]